MEKIDWNKPIELMDGTPNEVVAKGGASDSYLIRYARESGMTNMWCDTDGCIGGVQVVRNRPEPKKVTVDFG